MSRQQITGLGPVNTVTGEMKVFTASRTPYIATKEWLAEQSVQPAVGDYLDYEGDIVTVIAEATVSAAAAAANEGPQVVDGRVTKATQKKTDGGQGSGHGSGLSPLPSYTANPFVVTAGKITEIVGDIVTLENGATITVPGIGKAGRITVGDYWVSHEGEDGPGGFLPAAEFALMFTVKE